MENENQDQLNNVLELSPKPSRRSRRSKQSKKVEETILPVTIEEPIEVDSVKEMETIAIEAEAPAPTAPVPPAPVVAPNPEPAGAVQPKKSEWKPLVRPRRQSPPSSGPGRHQRKAR